MRKNLTEALNRSLSQVLLEQDPQGPQGLLVAAGLTIDALRREVQGLEAELAALRLAQQEQQVHQDPGMMISTHGHHGHYSMPSASPRPLHSSPPVPVFPWTPQGSPRLPKARSAWYTVAGQAQKAWQHLWHKEST